MTTPSKQIQIRPVMMYYIGKAGMITSWKKHDYTSSQLKTNRVHHKVHNEWVTESGLNLGIQDLRRHQIFTAPANSHS